MSAKNSIRLSLGALVITGVLLAWVTLARPSAAANSAGNETEMRCPLQKGKPKMGWEGISRQFFS